MYEFLDSLGVPKLLETMKDDFESEITRQKVLNAMA